MKPEAELPELEHSERDSDLVVLEELEAQLATLEGELEQLEASKREDPMLGDREQP